MWVRHFISIKVGGVPLWIIGICGLVSVLVDLDHLFSYWITGCTCQPAHPPLAIISCIILCGIGAYCGRLYFRMVLNRKRRNL